MRTDRDAARGSATLRLAATGFAATAVAFGPARTGFGLFLPAFREDFALSTNLSGLIASGGFLAFLFALPLAAAMEARLGPRWPVAAGTLSAAAGFAAVATAQGGAALAVGVALAGASAGFCWTPFNDAAERMAPPEARPGALSAVSTGATFGVAAAGALDLAVGWSGLDWRAAWGVFAFSGMAAATAAILALLGGRSTEGGGGGARAFLRRAAAPLYGAALLFGATNAAYLSFAADRVVAAGGLAGLSERAAAPVIFLAYGACGVVGIATGRIEARIGLAALLAAVFAAFAASLALIALAPGSWPGVLASAGLHGAAVMTISATLAFWSLRLFPGRGAHGFTAALLAAAAGGALGPALAGRALSAAGPETAFLFLALPPAAAAAALAAACLLPRARSARAPGEPARSRTAPRGPVEAGRTAC